MDIAQLKTRRNKMIFTTKAGTQEESTNQQLQEMEEVFFIQEGTITFPKHPNENSIAGALRGFRFEEKNEENWNGKPHEKIKMKTVFAYRGNQALVEQQFCLDRLEYAFYLDGNPTKEEEILDRLFVKLADGENVEILNTYLRQTLNHALRHDLWKKIYSENFRLVYGRKVVKVLKFEKVEAIETQEDAVTMMIGIILEEKKEKIQLVNNFFSGYLNISLVPTDEKAMIPKKLDNLIQKKYVELCTPIYEEDGLMVWSVKVFGLVVYTLLQEFQKTKEYELKRKFDPRMEKQIQAVMEKLKKPKKY